MKRKHLIIKRISMIFLISAVLTVTIGSIFVDMVYDRLIMTYTQEIADCAIEFSNSYVNAENVRKFALSGVEDKQYEWTRKKLRYVCESSGLKYMYIFVPEPNSSGKYNYKYVMTVATGDDDDEKIRSERGLGALSSDECLEDEMKVFRGELDNCGYSFSNKYGEVYTWIEPIKNESGEIVALIGADFDNTSIKKSRIQGRIIAILVLIPIILTLLVLLLVYLIRSVFMPIEKISHRLSVYDPNELFHANEIKTNGEIAEIAAAFEKMSLDMFNYISNIRQMTEERARSDAELETAKKIQSGIVPERYEINEKLFSAQGYAKSSKEVGGDFYDCFVYNNHVYLVIGDVSGKGIASALFMAMTKNMIHEKLCRELSPAQALNSANDEMCARNPEGMFVTAFVAIIDIETGGMIYANAGHLPPVLMSDHSRFLEIESGIALGLFEDSDICDQSAVLSDNDGLLLYTDGVTEAVSSEKKFFGAERLLETASSNDTCAFSVAKQIHEFEKGIEQFDDITLLSLRLNKAYDRRLMTLPCDIDAFDTVKDNIMQMIPSSENKVMITLACEEIFVNIAEYSTAQQAKIVLCRTSDRFIVRFEDDSEEFDPTKTIIDKEFEDLDQGGMGISLVMQIAEHCEYKRIYNKNILRITFIP